MRCLALVGALQESGMSCVFVARHISESLKRLIIAKGHTFIALPEDNLSPPSPDKGLYGAWLGTSEKEDAEAVLNALSKTTQRLGQPSLIMCDHYGLGQVWETFIADTFKAPIFVIDDLSNRAHKCHILLDTTFGKTAEDYKDLVPNECQLLVGSKYALLRPEFAKAREAALSRRDTNFLEKRPVEILVISMGGMDKDNVSLKMIQAVEALSPLPKFKVEVLVGKDCVHLPMLREYAAQSSLDIIVHGGVESVADLYSRADLCIGAAGSSTWERCCLGLPTINVTIAENQETIAETLSSTGAVINGGHFANIESNIFANTLLASTVYNHDVCHDLSETCRSICDGFGIERVMSEILNFTDLNENQDRKLVDANIQHVKTVFEWQKHPITRKYFVNKNIPSWAEHQTWMIKRLERVPLNYFIIEETEIPVGLVRCEDFSDNFFQDALEVSILVSPEHYGKNLATFGLKALVQRLRKRTLVAHIFDENKASTKLFSKCGFLPYKPEYFVYKGVYET